MRDVPPHNPLKLPLFYAGVVGGVLIVGLGLIVGSWWIAASGAVCLAVSVPSIPVVRSGRNPWWVRAPADRWWARRRGG
jgi:hypothetical protein